MSAATVDPQHYSCQTGPFTVTQLEGDDCAHCGQRFKSGQSLQEFMKIAEWTLFVHRGTCPKAAIRTSVRVSLLVNDYGTVSGTVEDVYLNVIGVEVADVRLPNGRIFTQNTGFLTAVSS